MKAAIINQFGGPEVFEIQDIEKPSIKPDHVLIKIKTVSINPIDWKQRKGNHKLILGSPFPIILGYDVCGKVLEVGSEIKSFKEGDEVFGVLDNKYGGALAEYAVGHEKCFALKPTNVSSEEAAGFPMVSLTSLQALRDKAKLKKGQTVLINGASGGVGHIAVQIAKLMEGRVIAVASTNSEEFVNQFKPDQFIDYTKQDILKLKEEVDVFFDVAGTYNFPQVAHLLNPGGTYVNTLPRPKILLHKLFQLFTKGKQAKTLLMKHNSTDLEIVREWIEKGKLKINIDKTFPLGQISEAHQYAQQGHNKGKNVVFIDN